MKNDGIAYADCAVLYRTNAQSRLLEERMVVEGIPYHVVGGVNFYARQEIRDILAYLKTIDNGRDEVDHNKGQQEHSLVAALQVGEQLGGILGKGSRLCTDEGYYFI